MKFDYVPIPTELLIFEILSQLGLHRNSKMPQGKIQKNKECTQKNNIEGTLLPDLIFLYNKIQ